jgi:hypothetical protein
VGTESKKTYPAFSVFDPSRRNLYMISKILIFVFFCLAGFSGCSGSAPGITEIRCRLTAFHDRQEDKTGEYLSVAVLAVDDDGQDDFESISVINDEEELYWQASQDEWTLRQVRQQSWIVLEKLVAPGEAVPRGRYRLVVRDYAGSQAESSFVLTAFGGMTHTFPYLDSEETSAAAVLPEESVITLVSTRGESVLMIRSAAGALLGSFILKQGANPLGAILANEQIRAQARDLYLWEQGAGSGQFLLAGPWPAEEFLFSVKETNP